MINPEFIKAALNRKDVDRVIIFCYNYLSELYATFKPTNGWG